MPTLTRLSRESPSSCLINGGIGNSVRIRLKNLCYYRLVHDGIVQKDQVSKEGLRNITCPALGLIGETKGKVQVRQAREFYEGISSTNKKLYIFTMEKDGTSDHVQIDNRTRGNQVMFDWLDELFDYRYEPNQA